MNFGKALAWAVEFVVRVEKRKEVRVCFKLLDCQRDLLCLKKSEYNLVVYLGTEGKSFCFGQTVVQAQALFLPC